jgi:dynactin complex subunit
MDNSEKIIDKLRNENLILKMNIDELEELVSQLKKELEDLKKLYYDSELDKYFT